MTKPIPSYVYLFILLALPGYVSAQPPKSLVVNIEATANFKRSATGRIAGAEKQTRARLAAVQRLLSDKAVRREARRQFVHSLSLQEFFNGLTLDSQKWLEEFFNNTRARTSQDFRSLLASVRTLLVKSGKNFGSKKYLLTNLAFSKS
jgi:hypothetical protein